MGIISRNLKFLRKQKNMTQQAFAELLGIKRSSLGAYEEGRAKPGFETLQMISELYGITIDQLIKADLAQLAAEAFKGNMRPDLQGNTLRVLSIAVDKENNELIKLIPEKAAAGYLSGYADPEYLRDLPGFQLPNLGRGSYRAFEISGDSMLPLQPGSVIIGEYVEDWHDLKDGQTYIIVSQNDGIVYKRVFNRIEDDGVLVLQSDNASYPPYNVAVEDVIEIWKAKAFISTIFPEKDMDMQKMMAMLLELQQEVIRLKKS
jgi:transcriptional regulator with XRE-family HTH domain